MNSIMNSQRIFDEIKLDDVVFSPDNLKRLIDIASIHGATIKRLEVRHSENGIYNGKIKMKDARLLFDKLPNLTELLIDSSIPIFDRVGKDEKPIIKNLKLFECYSDDDLDVMTKIIAPHTVETFKFNLAAPRFDEKFFKHQRKVKFLWCDFVDFPDPTPFNRLKIEAIEFPECEYEEDDGHALQLINDHAKTLRVLKFPLYEFPNNAVNAIVDKCLKLEKLSLKVNDDNIQNLLLIDYLEELHELGLNFAESFISTDILNEIAMMNLNIKKVSLQWSVEVPDADVDLELYGEPLENMSENWKNLEELEVINCRFTLDEILEKMENLKCINYVNPRVSKAFVSNGEIYSKVEKLRFSLKPTWFSSREGLKEGSIDLSHHLLKAFPNLQSLKVYKCFYEDESQLNDLSAMKKLRELKIGFMISSLKRVPRDGDVIALKKLCQSIEKCEIKFITTIESFNKSIVA